MHEGREFLSTAQGNDPPEHDLPERGLPEHDPQEHGPQARPLRLPRMNAHWARWCTAVFGARLQFPLRVGGRVWTWQPVWPSPWQHPAPTRWACALHGSVGGQPCTCWLDSAAPLAVPPLTEEDLSPPSESPLPEALLAAVMQDVIAASLAQLGAALGQQVTLHSLRCAPEDALPLEGGLPFRLTLAQPDEKEERDQRDEMGEAGETDNAGGPDADYTPQTTTVHGLLAAEGAHPLFAALYQAALNAQGQNPSGQNLLDWQESALPHWLQTCPLPCPIVWRTRPLALADIRALEAGDVLLMPCMADGDAGTLPVHIQVGLAGEKGLSPSYFAARWSAAQRTATLETAMQQDRTEYEESAASAVTETPEAADAQEAAAGGSAFPLSPDAAEAVPPAALDQCRVPLQCRLGEVSVTLAELSALAPGAVLHALDSVEAPVSLWLGATRIGRGALVDVDGRVGVRITEIIAAARRG